jgi:hypothetical protein
MRFLIPGLFLLASCGTETTSSFETYQDCFDDLTDNGGREVVDAIVQCCLDHPVGGDTEVCGDTMSDCVNYLTDNLSQFDADIGQRMEACTVVEDMLDV